MSDRETNLRSQYPRGRGHRSGKARSRNVPQLDLRPMPGICGRKRTRSDVALFLPFGCNKDQQTTARIGTRRRWKIVGVYEREGRIRQRSANRRKQRLTLLFPPVNRRVAGSSPARGANRFNSLRTPDLSSDLHVALFRFDFMRDFRRCPRAPGCSHGSLVVNLVLSQN